jgi:hypothetical protein
MYRCVVPPIRQAFPAGTRDVLLIMYDVVDAMLAGGCGGSFAIHDFDDDHALHGWRRCFVPTHLQ